MGTNRSDEADLRARILTRRSPAIGRSITDAFVIKDGDVFLVADDSGDVPEKGPHGFGLYYHDCRYLNAYVLRLGDERPIALVSTSTAGFKGLFELTNPDLVEKNGSTLEKHNLALRWDRVVEGARRALHDVIRVHNFASREVVVSLSLSFRSEFEDVATVRGLLPAHPGTLHAPRWEDHCLCLRYDGRDRIRRTTDVHLWRPPDETAESSARFELRIAPESEQRIALSILCSETPERDEEHHPSTAGPPDLGEVDRAHRATALRHAGAMTRIESDHVHLDRALRRALGDMGMLRSSLASHTYCSAGVPWFVALFGRDALLVALESLAYAPEIAEDTLRLLARYQGQVVDPARDEEPGKILHEMRVGELAHLGEIPHTPYYGSVDATPLFLVLLAQHALWTGRLDLLEELLPNVNAALGWIAEHGQSPTTGYVEYLSKASNGLANQGWKDSGDAIVMENGALARQPIALCEVQGYVYLAKTTLAVVLDRAGDVTQAALLRREAEALKQRFARDFWLADKGFFALALTPDGPAAVLSSNAGQTLWSGIADPEHARLTADSLLSPPMFSGWGIRTLSEEARRYNPIAYHRGTVWPHDNALIAAGFRRYGLDDAARRVFGGLLDASSYFPMHRLPEVFSGFRQADYGVPVGYPVACHPQAWAAGSLPYLLTSLLGITPEGFENRLRIVRPTLPRGIDSIEVRGLRVGGGSVDLDFERGSDGNVGVQVRASQGGIEVKVA